VKKGEMTFITIAKHIFLFSGKNNQYWSLLEDHMYFTGHYQEMFYENHKYWLYSL